MKQQTLRVYRALATTDVDFALPLSKIAKDLNLGSRTTLRELNSLIGLGYVKRFGSSKSTVYSLTPKGVLNLPIDLTIFEYDSRLQESEVSFNHEVFNWLLNWKFTKSEKETLDSASTLYQKKLPNISQTIKDRELERLIIEFSWKSSLIEGDTYSLLDTQRLLEEGIINPNKTRSETQIILNHKKAFDFIRQNPDYFKVLSGKKIIELHTLLVDELNISKDFRKSRVGITGSLYRPPENKFQIQESIEKFCELINSTSDHFKKAMFAILLIPYIQPFEDGNKRTSRLLANAILYDNNSPLLSYRNTKVENYRGSVLAFYEFNSIESFKNIFIEQIELFVQNYF